MKLVILGGTGLIGSYLSKNLVKKGYQITVLSRWKEGTEGSIKYVRWNPETIGGWLEVLANQDGIVNLVGESIMGYWSNAKKIAIYQSRVGITQKIVKALEKLEDKRPNFLIQASAVGIYGDRGEELLTENSHSGTDFLANLAKEWEKAGMTATNYGIRVVIIRTGIVLAKDGGFIANLLPITKIVRKVPVIGKGSNFIPWIDIEDEIRAIEFLISNRDMDGIFNLSAPNPVTVSELSKLIAKTITGKERIFHIPSSIVKLILGDLGKAILASQRVIPKRLLEAGFAFKYPTCESSITHLLT